jgi:hypothetical protein
MKKAGRPAMEPDDKRKPRSIKMTDKEWETIKRKAEEAGITTSEYIRIKAGGYGGSFRTHQRKRRTTE